MVLVAKFFSNPSAFSSLLCTIHPALFILNHKKKLQFMSSRVNAKPVNKSKENYQPIRSVMGTAAWSFQQTPRPSASLPCLQYGCEPPVRTMHVSNLCMLGIIFSARRNTYSIPRLIDDTLPGFLRSFSVPAHHVHRPSWEQTQQTQYFLTLTPWMHLTSTLLCYSDGCCSADSTVGTSDHKGPPHHRHIQVLWLKVSRCCFIALPRHGEKGKEKQSVLILLFCKRPNNQDDSQFATFSTPLVESGDAAIINMACQWTELLWLQPSWEVMCRSLIWYSDACP